MILLQDVLSMNEWLEFSLIKQYQFSLMLEKLFVFFNLLEQCFLYISFILSLSFNCVTR